MNLFKISLITAMVMLSLCMMLTLVRFLRGPSLPDRISAFDLFSASVIAIVAIYSELTNDEAYMDVAIILSLFAFLGSISFAYYLSRK